MVLIIDNYDSFVYNLARYITELDLSPYVARHDSITIEDIKNMKPTAIIISPGPCAPNQAGISLDAVNHFASSIPIIGVCLGHQVIAQSFGATVARANYPRHGKISNVYHDQTDLFEGIPSPFRATRYHSLSVQSNMVPDQAISITAYADDGEIMALRHKQWPIYGVQFHPEAVLTQYGKQILHNFLSKIKAMSLTQ